MHTYTVKLDGKKTEMKVRISPNLAKPDKIWKLHDMLVDAQTGNNVSVDKVKVLSTVGDLIVLQAV